MQTREFLRLIRRRLSANAGPKIAGFGLALFLWLLVTSGRSYETVMRLPVAVVELPDSLVVVNDIPAVAQVRVFGRGDRLLWLAFQEPRVQLSLKGEREGSFTRMLEPGDVVLPSESRVEVRQVVSPRVFQVEVDRLVARMVPARCLVEGTPAQGYASTTSAPTLVPELVRVHGPAGRVAGLKAMPVEPLVVTGAEDTVTAVLRVDVPDIKHLAVEPTHVRASLAVEPVREVRLDGIPVSVTGDGIPIPATVALLVTVPASRAAEASVLDSTDVMVRVSADSGDVTPVTVLPDWVLEARTIPARIAVGPSEE